jgi:hypothetical protein
MMSVRGRFDIIYILIVDIGEIYWVGVCKRAETLQPEREGLRIGFPLSNI